MLGRTIYPAGAACRAAKNIPFMPLPFYHPCHTATYTCPLPAGCLPTTHALALCLLCLSPSPACRHKALLPLLLAFCLYLCSTAFCAIPTHHTFACHMKILPARARAALFMLRINTASAAIRAAYCCFLRWRGRMARCARGCAYCHLPSATAVRAYTFAAHILRAMTFLPFIAARCRAAFAGCAARAPRDALPLLSKTAPVPAVAPRCPARHLACARHL